MIAKSRKRTDEIAYKKPNPGGIRMVETEWEKEMKEKRLGRKKRWEKMHEERNS